MKYNFKEEVPYFVNSSLSRGLSGYFSGWIFPSITTRWCVDYANTPNDLREISPKQKEEKFSRET